MNTDQSPSPPVMMMKPQEHPKYKDLLPGPPSSSATLELEQQEQQQHEQQPSSPISHTIFVAAIASGIQFSWSLQFSLLTPYVQLLGIPHKWASFIWLCGPISGMIVQPTVGFYSDRCTSRFGRRRPYIAVGTFFVIVSVFLIGFAADLGHLAGDPTGPGAKVRAISIFVVGFWVLDIANNMLTGPCRAFLADLSGGNQKKTRTANQLYSFFVSVGSILGYAAGSYNDLYHMLPFTKTEACDLYCANLKTCFLIAIVILLLVTILALTFVREKPLKNSNLLIPKERRLGGGGEDQPLPTSSVPFWVEVKSAFRGFTRPSWILFLVTFFTWIAWFPFFLYDTDWVGRDVYGGDAVHRKRLYDKGVRLGTLGLLLNSVVVGIVSLGTEWLARMVGGITRFWGLANLVLALGMGLSVLITRLADSTRELGATGPPVGIRVSTMALFALLGVPLAAAFSVPYALASIFSNKAGGGQGLAIGVLNLSIVIPQMIVSVSSGPWDDLFGGGNLPAFVVGGIAALISAVFALSILPSPTPEVIAHTTPESMSNGTTSEHT